MRRLACAAALVIGALAASPAHAASTQNVGIAGAAFKNGVCPQPTGTNIATVKVGDTVKWTNCDPGVHNITWKQPGFANHTLQGGASAQQVFNRAGFYDYYCSIHGTPTSDNMQGRVIVEGVAPATTAATQPAPTTTPSTIAPTTTASTPPSTVPATTTTTALSATTTTFIEDRALEPNEGGASGVLVAILLAAIAAAVGGGVYVVRRMRDET